MPRYGGSRGPTSAGCAASERLTSGKTALVAVEPANSAHPSLGAAWAVVLRRPALDLHVLCAGPLSALATQSG